MKRASTRIRSRDQWTSVNEVIRLSRAAARHGADIVDELLRSAAVLPMRLVRFEVPSVDFSFVPDREPDAKIVVLERELSETEVRSCVIVSCHPPVHEQKLMLTDLKVWGAWDDLEQLPEHAAGHADSKRVRNDTL